MRPGNSCTKEQESEEHSWHRSISTWIWKSMWRNENELGQPSCMEALHVVQLGLRVGHKISEAGSPMWLSHACLSHRAKTSLTHPWSWQGLLCRCGSTGEGFWHLSYFIHKFPVCLSLKLSKDWKSNVKHVYFYHFSLNLLTGVLPMANLEAMFLATLSNLSTTFNSIFKKTSVLSFFQTSLICMPLK